jgi:hypothetical protein
MRMPAALALLAAGLLMAGCYMSEAMLLNSAQAVHPVAVGRNLNATDSRPRQIEVSIDAGGWYEINEIGDDKKTRLLFTPLTTIGERILMAYVAKEDAGYIYGVAERRGAEILLDMPTCEPGPARDVAMAHNAIPPDPGTIGSVCEFEYPDDIHAALIAYARSPDIMREYARLPAAAE